MESTDDTGFSATTIVHALRRFLSLAIGGMTAYWSDCATRPWCHASP